MFRTLLARIRTFVLVPLFSALTLMFSAFIVIYGALRPDSPIHGKILHHWANIGVRIPPVHVDIVGSENADPQQRYIVVANHLSMFDIPLLLRFLPTQGRFLAKREIFKIPLLAQALRTLGIVEVNRKKRSSARQVIKDAVEVATDRGYSLLIFPEGTISTTGVLLPFKRGAFRIAIDTALPILPVVIEGTERVSRPGSKVFYPAHVTMQVLTPIETTGLTNKEHLTALTRQVETEMSAVYAEMRRASSL